MPALSSYAPNTRRPSLASTIAPAHWTHGSSVTYRAQSVRRSVWRCRSACCTASSSAWAVGSRRATVSLCARATMTPSRSTTAPTGTSPVDAARRASSSAAAIPGPSAVEAGRRFPFPVSRVPAFLCTRRFGRRRGHALEAERIAVFRPLHADSVTFGELPLEHGERERVLQQPLDRPLERPGTIHRIVAFRHDQLLGRRGHLEAQLALRHEPLHPLDLEIDDASDVLARERPADDHVVHPVQELGLERRAHLPAALERGHRSPDDYVVHPVQ